MGAQPREIERQQVAALALASACSSSRMTYLSEPNSRAASSCDSMSAICSGVVSRMSGGVRRWRARRDGRRIAGAGLERDGQVHLRDGDGEVARDVGRERLQGRHIKRVEAGFTLLVSRPVRSTRLGRNPASVLPPPVGAIRSASLPALPPRAAQADADGAASPGLRTKTQRARARVEPAPPRGSPRDVNASVAGSGAAATSLLFTLLTSVLLDLLVRQHQFCCNSSEVTISSRPAL